MTPPSPPGGKTTYTMRIIKLIWIVFLVTGLTDFSEILLILRNNGHYFLAIKQFPIALQNTFPGGECPHTPQILSLAYGGHFFGRLGTNPSAHIMHPSLWSLEPDLVIFKFVAKKMTFLQTVTTYAVEIISVIDFTFSIIPVTNPRETSLFNPVERS